MQSCHSAMPKLCVRVVSDSGLHKVMIAGFEETTAGDIKKSIKELLNLCVCSRNLS